jgi:hypothetical protein
MEIKTRIHGVARNNETETALACRSIPCNVYAVLATSTRECVWIIQ